jgi:hypothetical protein
MLAYVLLPMTLYQILVICHRLIHPNSYEYFLYTLNHA